MPFVKDDRDRFMRIWIEQPLENTEEIEIIQKEIRKLNPTFIPYNPEKLHMTLFHIGMPDKLYEEFKVINPQLEFMTFISAMEEFLAYSGYLTDTGTFLKVLGFDLLGSRKNPKVVLVLEKDKYIEETRKKIIVGLVELFNKLQVPDQIKFIENSPNLRYSVNRNYIPHVTLGVLNEKDTTFVPSEINLENIKLQPSRVSNFTLV